LNGGTMYHDRQMEYYTHTQPCKQFICLCGEPGVFKIIPKTGKRVLGCAKYYTDPKACKAAVWEEKIQQFWDEGYTQFTSQWVPKRPPVKYPPLTRQDVKSLDYYQNHVVLDPAVTPPGSGDPAEVALADLTAQEKYILSEFETQGCTVVAASPYATVFEHWTFQVCNDTNEYLLYVDWLSYQRAQLVPANSQFPNRGFHIPLTGFGHGDRSYLNGMASKIAYVWRDDGPLFTALLVNRIELKRLVRSLLHSRHNLTLSSGPRLLDYADLKRVHLPFESQVTENGDIFRQTYNAHTFDYFIWVSFDTLHSISKPICMVSLAE
jgi:hypothetical protein